MYGVVRYVINRSVRVVYVVLAGDEIMVGPRITGQ